MSVMFRATTLMIPRQLDDRLRGLYFTWLRKAAETNAARAPGYGEFLIGLIDIGVNALVKNVVEDRARRGLPTPLRGPEAPE